MRFARAGALVRIVCKPNACEVCRARSRRIYAPSDVPRLPVRGCKYGVCRCRFVAVDPETELTVPQLVERGITALRAGRTEIAQEMLRKAVAFDEMYEPGWLWLGAVVDDREKVKCLEKALAINPRNARVRSGLEFLRKKLAQTRLLVRKPTTAILNKPKSDQEEEEAEEAETAAIGAAADEYTAETASLLTEVAEIREERRVIVEQWEDFVRFAVETDPEMLMMQGQAFLKKLQTLDEQALEMLQPDARLEELHLQWRESERLGTSLLGTIDAHRSRRDGTRGWQAMHDSLRLLAQQLSDHGRELRSQISAAGGQIALR